MSFAINIIVVAIGFTVYARSKRFTRKLVAIARLIAELKARFAPFQFCQQDRSIHAYSFRDFFARVYEIYY